MRTTVTNLLGALPPTYFTVTVSAKVEDLAQLMFSMLMTGYMYRNAQYRIDLDYIRRSYGKHFVFPNSNPNSPPRQLYCLVVSKHHLFAIFSKARGASLIRDMMM